MTQWRLPDRLNEISGLAITPDGRLLSVDDEVAVVYELNYDDGHMVKAFALGKPVVKGDFEGIAVIDDLIYLTNSAGRVYISAEGADGQRVGSRSRPGLETVRRSFVHLSEVRPRAGQEAARPGRSRSGKTPTS